MLPNETSAFVLKICSKVSFNLNTIIWLLVPCCFIILEMPPKRKTSAVKKGAGGKKAKSTPKPTLKDTVAALKKADKGKTRNAKPDSYCGLDTTYSVCHVVHIFCFTLICWAKIKSFIHDCDHVHLLVGVCIHFLPSYTKSLHTRSPRHTL